MAVNRSRYARAAHKPRERMGRVEHDLSDEQWSALTAGWGGCTYRGAAGTPLQRDCVLALPRGALHAGQHRARLQLVQRQQVPPRGHRPLRRKRFAERAFLTRHAEIQAGLASQFPTAPAGAAAEE